MAFEYKNKKGNTYYLHQKPRKTRSGDTYYLYFFSREKKDGALDKVPDGFTVKETENGMPVLKKK